MSVFIIVSVRVFSRVFVCLILRVVVNAIVVFVLVRAFCLNNVFVRG